MHVGIFVGVFLGCGVPIVILIIAAIVAKLFTIEVDEYRVFWLAALGIPSLIVLGCTLWPITRVRGADRSETNGDLPANSQNDEAAFPISRGRARGF